MPVGSVSPMPDAVVGFITGLPSVAALQAGAPLNQSQTATVVDSHWLMMATETAALNQNADPVRIGVVPCQLAENRRFEVDRPSLSMPCSGAELLPWLGLMQLLPLLGYRITELVNRESALPDGWEPINPTDRVRPRHPEPPPHRPLNRGIGR